MFPADADLVVRSLVSRIGVKNIEGAVWCGVVRLGILIAVKHEAVHRVAVLKLGYDGLRHVAAGSDPVGRDLFPKSDPHFKLQIRSLHATAYTIELLQLLFSPL